MSTREQRQNAVAQFLGDLAGIELAEITRADVHEQVEIWRAGFTYELNREISNELEQLAWEGLQELIAESKADQGMIG